MKTYKTLMKNLLNFIYTTFLVLSVSTSLLSQSCADGSYSFDDDIAPILNAKCASCHGTQGGYSVATYMSTLAGGNNCGAAVTPGDATATGSSLIDKLQWVNGGPNAVCGANMPTSGTPLTVAEYMAIEAWIAAGAQESCALACPTSDFVVFEPDNICEGTTLDFLLNIEISDPDGTQLGGLMWFEGTDPTVDPMADVTAPVVHSSANPCSNSGGNFYYAFVQCDTNLDGVFDLNNGDQWAQLATYIYSVVPAPQSPTISLDDDACNYTIVPACPNDILSVTTITAAPGEDPAPIDVVVSSFFCEGIIYQLDPPTCPTATMFECPTSETFSFQPEYICEGNVLTFAGNTYTITDTDGTQLGEVMWFAGPDPTVDPIFDITAPVVHMGADPCNIENVLIYAFVQCDADLDGVFDLNNGDQWIGVNGHAFIMFPEKQIPTITLDDDVCNYTITPVCPGDVLSITTLTAASGEDPPPIDVEVGMACTTIFQIDPPACPDAGAFECPSAELMQFDPDIGCEGALIYDFLYSLQFGIDDPDGTQLGNVVWFVPSFPNFDPTTDMMVEVNTTLVHSGANFCDIETIAYYVAVQCDSNLDGIFDLNDGDQWAILGNYEIWVLPEKQAPTITLDDDVCNYTIIPACLGDVLSITTLVAAPGEDPAPIEVEVSMGCATTFLLDPPACPSGVCEDAIMGTVITDEPTCNLAGILVEILDSNGMAVAGSPVAIDAMGNYFLAGPFACGTYTAQIVAGTAPLCYEQLGGTEGPFEFEVDGDGTADGADFGTTPQIPTLSQWGLITLALLMMCFGAIKMAFRRNRLLGTIKK